VWLLGLSLILAVSAATVLCQAGEPKKDADKKELTAEDMDRALEEIALAYRLAAAGRKASSPEALLGAAKIFSKLNAKEIGLTKLEGVKPLPLKDKKKPRSGEPIKEDGGKPTSFAADIKKLKEDARKLNTPKDENLAALIDLVPEKGRGSLGGPKWMGPFTLKAYDPANTGDQPDRSKGFTFKFRDNQPAHVLVRNKNEAELQLIIWPEEGADCDADHAGPGAGGDGRILDISGITNLEFKWRPKGTCSWTVSVTNLGDYDAQFEIFKN
jgi:hypothetical protein